MLTAMKGWIITICSTLFFITAVEMILPSNSMKKYCKFVLGLILITVIISPFVKIFTEGGNLETFTNNITNNINGNNPDIIIKKYREENINNTLNIFKINLCKSIEEKLLDKFPKKNFKVTVEATYDNSGGTYILNNVTVRTDSDANEKVSIFLMEELKIGKEKINVLKG